MRNVEHGCTYRTAHQRSRTIGEVVMHTVETKRKICAVMKKHTQEKSPTRKGGRRLNHNGYVEIFLPEHHRARGNGYVFEHILVAEEKIGRRLLRGEQVHHIDHNKTNNNPDNLQVMSASEHAKRHPQIRTGIEKTCEVCGRKFYVKPSHLKVRRTCSFSCAGTIGNRIRFGRTAECLTTSFLSAD